MAYDKSKIRVREGWVEAFVEGRWHKLANGDVRNITPEQAEIEAEKRYLQWFKGINEWQYASKGINFH